MQKKRLDMQTSRARHHDPVAASTAASAQGALKQFSLPAFTRFAKKFESDSVIIAEYEPGDCFYLIQSGRVQLVKCVKGAKKKSRHPHAR